MSNFKIFFRIPVCIWMECWSCSKNWSQAFNSEMKSEIICLYLFFMFISMSRNTEHILPTSLWKLGHTMLAPAFSFKSSSTVNCYSDLANNIIFWITFCLMTDCLTVSCSCFLHLNLIPSKGVFSWKKYNLRPLLIFLPSANSVNVPYQERICVLLVTSLTVLCKRQMIQETCCKGAGAANRLRSVNKCSHSKVY